MVKLPDANAPLLIGNGVSIPPSTAQGRIEIPSNTQAQRLIASTRRKLIDLPPISEKAMSSYAVLLIYTASGLSDQEISATMGLTVEQINRIREQSAYGQLEQYMIEAVQEQSKSQVTAILAGKEVRAAERIGELLDSEDHKVSLAASNSILDRRGHGSKQQVDAAQQIQHTFRIEVVDRRVIDVENTERG